MKEDPPRGECEYCSKSILIPKGHGIDHHVLHCSDRLCVEFCPECKDMSKALENDDKKRGKKS